MEAIITTVVIRADPSNRERLAVKFERCGKEYYRVLVTEWGVCGCDPWVNIKCELCEEVEK